MAPRWLTAGLAALVLAMTIPACAKKAPQDRFAGMTAEQIYEIASKQIEKKQYLRARTTLQKALGRSDLTPDLISRVHLALADAYFYDGGVLNLAEALSRYTNFLTFYPNHARADYVQYQLGLCYLKQLLNADRDQAQTKKAIEELVKVRNLYPSSDYAGQAEQKADEAREVLAEHDFRIASFYYKQRAYSGAVQRFRDILESFPNYSRKDRLYLTLGQSLFALDKKDEGRLYLQRLLGEFPDSRYAGEAKQLLAEPVETAGNGS